MSGIAGITSRMLEIQSMIDRLSPTPTPTVAAQAPATSFDDALGQAVKNVAGAQAAAAPQSPADVAWAEPGVPAELAKYGNGKVPAEALTQISGSNHRLWAPAAGAFEQLRAAAAKDGVDIGITDSYRSFDAQVDVAKRKGLYKNGGLAAVPGTSPHGWGVALDLKLDAKAQAWMRANAGDFGYVEDTPREPWHWVFKK
ncbi:D-alanyl-D-alanine carboxypeptidase-like protein [Flavimobilis soli]|uniref:D-alanyl-D-alanine carboxypeptidase-like protein n=1 Tax=Flavimobilis soli TaxID=442709 RepID=A0A2A9E9Q6_9MICO|nr:M15 family metallopeptidase [Flavimobilis soli]PFG35564.1 D-alanyl-D-alanine carboxypeptidase-like protein [Flavimobilis soli]